MMESFALEADQVPQDFRQGTRIIPIKRLRINAGYSPNGRGWRKGNHASVVFIGLTCIVPAHTGPYMRRQADTMTALRDEMKQVLEQADCLADAALVERAIHRVATEVVARLGDSHPIVLSVMNGALIFAGQLLPLLSFPLETDYCHATRYGPHTLGGELEWRVRPSLSLTDRNVLIIDDVLDEGYTLQALIQACTQLGARRVWTAVLCEKVHERKAIADMRADFCGLKLPDRFIFGCGMDYHGHWRNLPAIYAIKDL